MKFQFWDDFTFGNTCDFLHYSRVEWVTFPLCLLPLFRAPRVSMVLRVELCFHYVCSHSSGPPGSPWSSSLLPLKLDRRAGSTDCTWKYENLAWGKMLITKRDLKMVIMRVQKKTSTLHLDQLPVLRGGVLELNPWLEEAGEGRVGECEGGSGRHHRHRWVRRVSHSLEMMFDSSVYHLAHRFTLVVALEHSRVLTIFCCTVFTSDHPCIESKQRALNTWVVWNENCATRNREYSQALECHH